MQKYEKKIKTEVFLQKKNNYIINYLILFMIDYNIILQFCEVFIQSVRVLTHKEDENRQRKVAHSLTR